MSTKNDPGKYDCYAKADPDEPMFVLLARDELAPILVSMLACLYELRDGSPEKVQEALDCADAMIQWRYKRHAK